MIRRQVMLASPEWLRTTGHLQVLWSARSDAKAQTGRFFCVPRLRD